MILRSHRWTTSRHTKSAQLEMLTWCLPCRGFAGGMNSLQKIPIKEGFELINFYSKLQCVPCVQSVIQTSATMNLTTGNGSTESSRCTMISDTPSRIGKTIYLGLILAVSLVGNSLIVTIVYKTPTLRKPINYFIANMAISDLLYPIFWLPLHMSELHTNYSWLIGGKFGHALCKLLPFLGDVSTVVSIQNLILIAVDRFGAVVFPLRSPLIRSKLCTFFILATWIVAVVVNLPYSFAFKVVEDSGEMWCCLEWEIAFGESLPFAKFIVAYYSLFIYLPVMLLVTLYSIILIKLKTQTHPGEQSANNQQQWNRRNRNVLQMSIAIILVFVFCVLPPTVIILIREYYWASSWNIPRSFDKYSHVTFYINSAYCAANPIVCFIFSSNYRQGLKRFINCCTFAQA